MVISQTGICNTCLIRLGEEPISLIDEDTPRALILSKLWDLTAKAELRRKRWRFATKWAGPLTPDATTPEGEWDYEYTIPNDCLMVHGISENIDQDENSGLEWSVHGKKLRCNESTIYLKYTEEVTDISQWDPAFAEAVALRLAMKSGYKLTQSRGLVADVTKEYVEFMQDAGTLSAMEASTKPLVFVGGWLEARRGTGTGLKKV